MENIPGFSVFVHLSLKGSDPFCDGHSHSHIFEENEVHFGPPRLRRICPPLRVS